LQLALEAAYSPPRAAGEAVLSLSDVGKDYGSGRNAFAALSGISGEIRSGELVLLMGPSGSGKTTLLSIMGGIVRPSTGRISVCGHELSRLAEAERCRVRLAHIGFVFQNYNLFPTLTARQNVELVLDLKGIVGPARRADAAALLAVLDLEAKADAYPAELSGGQKQRVAIARALAGAPRLLLADEPTAALDAANGRRTMRTFRELTRARGCAAVVVTHDSRIAEFADRILMIEDGRIVDERGAKPGRVGPAALKSTLLHVPRWKDEAV
ncbi:MAG: ABC transporter ATP-binding protein, partial [Stellaceae bacterium]